MSINYQITVKQNDDTKYQSGSVESHDQLQESLKKVYEGLTKGIKAEVTLTYIEESDEQRDAARARTKQIVTEEFEKMKKNGEISMADIKTCSICKKRFSEYGNNPIPFSGNVCCDQCNEHIVVPMRIYGNICEPSYAVLFKADGSLKSIKPKDKYFTLKELQGLVGGLIELYPKRANNHLVVCNEEGLILGLPRNDLFHKYTGNLLVGDVLLCPESIFEEPEERCDE